MALVAMLSVILAAANVEPLSAQNTSDDSYITVSGTVCDRQTNNRLESVSISAQGTDIGTVTNADGFFTLKVPKSLNVRSLTVSNIGYTNQVIPLNGSDISNVRIVMVPNAIMLQEVVVLGGDATRLVQEAVYKIGDNYPAVPNLLTGFYRETIQKRRRYIDISEAVINVSKSSYTRDTRLDRVKLFKGRRLLSQRTKDTLTVKLEGGPYLSVVMDIVKNRDLLLSEEEMANYMFRYGVPVMIDNREHISVTFQPVVVLPYPLYSGTLYIDKETHTISRVEFSLDMSDLGKATQAMLRKKPVGLRFRPDRLDFVVAYRLADDGRSYLNYVSSEAEFRCDWKKRLFSTRYSVRSEMVVTDRTAEGVTEIPYRDSFRSNQSLTDKVMDFYDPDFWGDYNIIEPTESLEKAVERLKKQYK